jgi:hypothetical protein
MERAVMAQSIYKENHYVTQWYQRRSARGMGAEQNRKRPFQKIAAKWHSLNLSNFHPEGRVLVKVLGRRNPTQSPRLLPHSRSILTAV